MTIMRTLAAAAFALYAQIVVAQTPATTDSLRVYYVGRAVGWERYTLTAAGSARRLDAETDYTDRGRRNRIQARLDLSSDFAPTTLGVARLSDTTRTVVMTAEIDGRRATVTKGGQKSEIQLPDNVFAISQYLPMSQHLALMKFWKARGSPNAIDVLIGSVTNRVSIKRQGIDTIHTSPATLLTRYSIDGVIWGSEYLWLDQSDRLAVFAAAGGGLSTKGIRGEFVPAVAEIMTIAARAAIRDLAVTANKVQPIAFGSIALTGATLVDGTGRDAISDATVVVVDGKIVGAGPRDSVRIPRGAKRIDVRGKTIVPGLWDMHAHLHQWEWIPVYLAAGVTTVRDMGNELPFITALRANVNGGRIAGPRIISAGLVDGGGVNAFGEFSATTPGEGREIVRRYHALGFEQMKLYSLLTPDAVGAIADEAHKLGMTVTGHLPNSLSLLAAVDSGMDQFAHLPIRADVQTDSGKRVLAYLKQRGTVFDPTVSWSEIGGHSTSESLQAFQPVLQHLPATFVQFRVANWGSAVTDTAAAHARLARTLATIEALHDAGIPVVAGTDEGVPGFSVYREIELYVKAGFTPMEALRAATAVPAKAMRMESEVGTLEAGKRADLLLLDGNPLDDIANIRRVKWVMKGGRLYDSSELWRAIGFVP